MERVKTFDHLLPYFYPEKNKYSKNVLSTNLFDLMHPKNQKGDCPKDSEQQENDDQDHQGPTSMQTQDMKIKEVDVENNMICYEIDSSQSLFQNKMSVSTSLPILGTISKSLKSVIDFFYKIVSLLVRSKQTVKYIAFVYFFVYFGHIAEILRNAITRSEGSPVARGCYCPSFLSPQKLNRQIQFENWGFQSSYSDGKQTSAEMILLYFRDCISRQYFYETYFKMSEKKGIALESFYSMGVFLIIVYMVTNMFPKQLLDAAERAFQTKSIFIKKTLFLPESERLPGKLLTKFNLKLEAYVTHFVKLLPEKIAPNDLVVDIEERGRIITISRISSNQRTIEFVSTRESNSFVFELFISNSSITSGKILLQKIAEKIQKEICRFKQLEQNKKFEQLIKVTNEIENKKEAEAKKMPVKTAKFSSALDLERGFYKPVETKEQLRLVAIFEQKLKEFNEYINDHSLWKFEVEKKYRAKIFQLKKSKNSIVRKVVTEVSIDPQVLFDNFEDHTKTPLWQKDTGKNSNRLI